ncbi:hypothetical protein Hanom_Chr10g00941551 [Helianthus anomalus]
MTLYIVTLCIFIIMSQNKALTFRHSASFTIHNAKKVVYLQTPLSISTYSESATISQRPI